MNNTPDARSVPEATSAWRERAEAQLRADGEPAADALLTLEAARRLIQELRIERLALELHNQDLQLALQASGTARGEPVGSATDAAAGTAPTAAEQTADAAKSRFLASVSQEIRTPLNVISGVTYLVRHSTLSKHQADLMEKLDSATRQLITLVDAVLDLSKMAAGRLILVDYPVAVETLPETVADRLHARARAKGLQLRVEVGTITQGVWGDAARLYQALLNYANNALQFTERGHISLRVQQIEEDATSVLLRFEVEDTGIGIAADQLPRLFHAFEQAEPFAGGLRGGIGLGLAITRQLAELMGGAAGASSTLGVGSTFWLTARLRKGPATRTGDAPIPLEAAKELLLRQFKGRRVLLVEDEPMNRTIVQSILEQAGLQVACAEDGDTAVAAVRDQAYDIILMDLRMPRMNGFAATQEIRSLANGTRVPILALTASALASTKVQCLESGMDDFIAKPADAGALFATLFKWLSREQLGA